MPVAQGWPAGIARQPDRGYATSCSPSSTSSCSLPPPVGASPAAGTVCFGGGGGSDCTSTARVRAVSCGAFVLWELPTAPSDDCSGYCIGFSLQPTRELACTACAESRAFSCISAPCQVAAPSREESYLHRFCWSGIDTAGHAQGPGTELWTGTEGQQQCG